MRDYVYFSRFILEVYELYKIEDHWILLEYVHLTEEVMKI